MALVRNDKSTVIASRGSIFIADANTPLPAGGLNDLAKIMAGIGVPTVTGWDRLANTSRENLPEFTLEAGDPTQKGSWDTPTIRTVYGDQLLSYTIHPMQHDAESVAKVLNGWKSEDGHSAVLGATDWSFDCAVAIVINDGGMISGFYIPNNTATPSGLPALSIEDFSEFEVSLQAKPADPKAIPLHTDGRTGLIRIFEPVPYTSV